jgi:serine/threonine protein kinase
VTIYEVGASDGTSFIAMELVEGKTLRELLASGPLPPRRLLPLAAQVASGLSRAHAAGIVHRDLKPENLMVTREGLVKILDFGLAKLVPSGLDSDATNLPTMTRGTEAGTILGTVSYMSPEQASAEPLDFRSDQFAFGSILYEMVSGKRAFHRQTAAQTLSAIIEAEPEPLARVSPSTPTNLLWIVERCLAKDPEERYGSTKDLARDLATVRDHSSGISVSGVEPPAARRMRLSRWALAVSAAAAVGVAVLTLFAGRRLQSASITRRPRRRAGSSPSARAT